MRVSIFGEGTFESYELTLFMNAEKRRRRGEMEG